MGENGVFGDVRDGENGLQCCSFPALLPKTVCRWGLMEKGDP